MSRRASDVAADVAGDDRVDQLHRQRRAAVAFRPPPLSAAELPLTVQLVSVEHRAAAGELRPPPYIECVVAADGAVGTAIRSEYVEQAAAADVPERVAADRAVGQRRSCPFVEQAAAVADERCCR